MNFSLPYFPYTGGVNFFSAGKGDWEKKAMYADIMIMKMPAIVSVFFIIVKMRLPEAELFELYNAEGVLRVLISLDFPECRLGYHSYSLGAIRIAFATINT